MAEVRIKDIDEHEIDTILAEDIDFEGHLTFKKPLMIKGKFKGEIKSTSSLYIGEKAYVEATTEAGIISSKGTHKGNIQAHSRVELFSTARVEGDIETPDFIMESGCKFNGFCNMGGAGHPTTDKQPSPQAHTPQHSQNQQSAQQRPQQAAPAPTPPQQQGAQQGQSQGPQQGPQKPPQGQGGAQR
jgi:cytoskeletal protein CcmA (bactofilin family)